MIKIEDNKLDVNGNVFDITAEITYAVAYLSQKIQNNLLSIPMETADFF